MKPVIDRAGAFLGLIGLAPLFLIIAAAIMLSDPGNPFYVQSRLGRNGRMFRCIKFRSMVLDGDDVLARHLNDDPVARREWESTRKLRSDPRITGIGSVLRKSSLDELPQLLNVLRGDMSLVGPRPIVEDEAVYYGTAFGHYSAVLPGLTGLWQVSGRNDVSYQERVRLDRLYVETMSLATDAMILTRTVRVVLFRVGSY
ncbi:sugar transferase [Wenxinia saemankumensis]|uniref:Exopolysaccharide production protein ExoY n=1 Tax=Wenxinia saemankumensis TaxID=1447782 RepID=A0A1M5ZYA5_9RHOB|nr:sugar transferase [Wenxinia saemankumensis]SHI29244.1 exopolysaccharide production protein ExoY [Wenxinia saemankumensis]